MAYRDRPDSSVAPDDQRCEALTKPQTTWQDWRRTPHRCIRPANQGRDGRMVCATHARVKKVTYVEN